MFEQISDRFNSLIRDLRGLGKITDKNITDTSREIRRILLEADVNINVTREFVNKVKNREQFRPFAGSVVEELSHEWVDLDAINGESPYMLYTVPVLQNKRIFIPAITHVDGSCRVQTVKKGTIFYSIINEFFIRTNIPILLNTSFNLAGQPLVHTLEDAKQTFYNSELYFLYDANTNTLMSK